MVRLPAGSVSNLIQFNLSCSSLIRGSRGKKKKKKKKKVEAVAVADATCQCQHITEYVTGGV